MRIQADIVDSIKKAIEGKRERKFKQTLELIVNLKDIDPKNPSHRIDELVPLPEGPGKEPQIAIFASSQSTLQLEGAAERIISGDELSELTKNQKEIKKLADEFDYFLAEAPLMLTIGKVLGKALGPRGKMPRPIPPGSDPRPVVEQLKKSVRIRSHTGMSCHAPVGVEDMTQEQLGRNIAEVIRRIESKLPQGKANIASVWIKFTMGSPVRVM
jgi:large subunit ribosomal protein L1